jgi:hypothetical protein
VRADDDQLPNHVVTLHGGPHEIDPGTDSPTAVVAAVPDDRVISGGAAPRKKRPHPAASNIEDRNVDRGGGGKSEADLKPNRSPHGLSAVYCT